MKTGQLFLPLAAALMTAGPANAASDAGITQAPPATDFNPVQRYDISDDEPRDLAEFYVRQLGLKMRQADYAEFDNPDGAGTRIALVTIEGIENEAIAGVQWRFVMRASQGRWEVVEAGLRRSCKSGPDAGRWTRNTCP